MQKHWDGDTTGWKDLFHKILSALEIPPSTPPTPQLCGKYPEFVVSICLSALEVQSEIGASCSKALANSLTSAGENHVLWERESVRLHRMNCQHKGRTIYRRESERERVTSLPLKLHVLVSPQFSLQPCLTTSVTKKTELHTGACTLLPSSCSTACTIPWSLSATTISHHLHTKLAWPFCHLRSSVLRASCLLSVLYHPLYHFFPFSTRWCYPCCSLSFTDLFPSIPLPAPTLPSQIPADP